MLRKRTSEAKKIASRLSHRGSLLFTAADARHHPGHHSPHEGASLESGEGENDEEDDNGADGNDEQEVNEDDDDEGNENSEEEASGDGDAESEVSPAKKPTRGTQKPPFSGPTTKAIVKFTKQRSSGHVFSLHDDRHGRLVFMLRRTTADYTEVIADTEERTVTFRQKLLPLNADELAQVLHCSKEKAASVLAASGADQIGQSEHEYTVEVPSNYILTDQPESVFTPQFASVFVPRVGVGRRVASASAPQRL